MFNWAKQQLANVAGTPEPIYGPSAIKSVATQAATTPYTVLTRDDLKWTNMNDTSVETQVFYFTSDAGHIGMAQIIHSNVAGIRRTTQFNTKIMYPKSENKPHLWSSNDCSKIQFIDNMTSFMAEDVAVLLSEDGKSYTIKAMINPDSLVNLKVTQNAPGFVVGQDGKTLYGTDMQKPWGSMRHAFWPRCTVEGAIVTKEGPITFSGKSMFVHALQGMKPHHAAAKWRFGNFQGPTYSAVMMEYTTPPSYGSTVVNVGGIATDTEIVMAGASNTAAHSKIKKDTQNDWPEPEEVKFEWNGKTKDGKPVTGLLEGSLGERLDKIDVMVEVPAFVKQIAGQVAGTKPWIYQYSPDGLSLKLKIGDEEITEAGNFFSEATFICE